MRVNLGKRECNGRMINISVDIILCVECLKNDTKELIYKTEIYLTDIENKIMVISGK